MKSLEKYYQVREYLLCNDFWSKAIKNAEEVEKMNFCGPKQIFNFRFSHRESHNSLKSLFPRIFYHLKLLWGQYCDIKPKIKRHEKCFYIREYLFPIDFWSKASKESEKFAKIISKIAQYSKYFRFSSCSPKIA